MALSMITLPNISVGTSSITTSGIHNVNWSIRPAKPTPALPPDPIPSSPLNLKRTMNLNWIFKAVGTVTLIASWLPGSLADGKISISEMLDLGVRIANHFGIDVDHEGIDLGLIKASKPNG